MLHGILLLFLVDLYFAIAIASGSPCSSALCIAICSLLSLSLSLELSIQLSRQQRSLTRPARHRVNPVEGAEGE